MNAKKLKKAMKRAESNIKLFETRESGSVRIGKKGQTTGARGIKKAATKKGYRGVTTKRSKPTSTSIKKTQAASKKGYRGITTKRSKPTSTGIKKTQAATKTYTPKKKPYVKPGFGSIPKYNLHVYGPFDGLFSGKGHAGVSGGLNRCERIYPGTYAIIKEWVDEGRITWKDVQDSFAQYYFDERNEDGSRYEYLLSPYEVFSSGYQNFMVNLSSKAGFDKAPEIAYEPVEGEGENAI